MYQSDQVMVYIIYLRNTVLNMSLMKNQANFTFLPSAHSGHRVLSCPAPSVRPSVRPAIGTTLQPTIFNGFCSYLVQPLTLVGPWTLLIMGSLCWFSRILWDFEILGKYWRIGIWGCPCYRSTAHNIERILLIFHTANNLRRSMNPIDHGFSVLIF